MNPYPFIPSLELSRRFYFEAVRPILDQHFPGLPHSAALIGYGSEVLELDTPMSMDHNWHPRVLVFLREADMHQADPMRAALANHLPHLFQGIPVDAIPVPNEPGTRWMAHKEQGEVEHVIHPTSLRDFVHDLTAWDCDKPLETADWLSIPSQKLRELTAGAVFHDGTGELTHLRDLLAWYPDDIWRYLLACGWNGIGQDEHLMPRAGYVGDELGSALIGGRLVNQIMRQCYLMEKRYAPYAKWFGSDFKRLACAGEMIPLLESTLRAKTWQERQDAFGQACLRLARLHNALGLTAPLPEELSLFHGRPFPVLHSEAFANALREQIENPVLRRFAARGLIGNIDQFSDNSELKSNIAAWRAGLKKLFEE